MNSEPAGAEPSVKWRLNTVSMGMPDLTASMTAESFFQLLDSSSSPLVIRLWLGWPRKRYLYMTVYKGVIFTCSSPEPLSLPAHCEVAARDGKGWGW